MEYLVLWLSFSWLMWGLYETSCQFKRWRSLRFWSAPLVWPNYLGAILWDPYPFRIKMMATIMSIFCAWLLLVFMGILSLNGSWLLLGLLIAAFLWLVVSIVAAGIIGETKGFEIWE